MEHGKSEFYCILFIIFKITLNSHFSFKKQYIFHSLGNLYLGYLLTLLGQRLRLLNLLWSCSLKSVMAGIPNRVAVEQQSSVSIESRNADLSMETIWQKIRREVPFLYAQRSTSQFVLYHLGVRLTSRVFYLFRTFINPLSQLIFFILTRKSCIVASIIVLNYSCNDAVPLCYVSRSAIFSHQPEMLVS